MTRVPDEIETDTIDGLFRAHWAELNRLAYLMINDRGIAEELVQEAFLRLERRLRTIERPDAYLRQTVANLARDHHRRARIARRYPAPPLEPTFNPETDETWSWLASLPRRQRQALVLRYYADYSIDSVAEALGCAPGTARSLIHRGLAALRKRHANHG